MKLELFEKVRVKSNGAVGDIVDIDEYGKITVEGDEGATEEGAIYGGRFPLYYVDAADIERLGGEKPGFHIAKKVAML